jgi:hypothetical protein
VTPIGVVARALAVALVTATLLLSIADHHAVTRLPEVALQLGHADADLHSLFVHHHARPHGQRPATATSRDPATHVYAPAAPPTVGQRGLAPEAAPAADLTLPPIQAVRTAGPIAPLPTGLLEPPPKRPPNRAA